MDEQRLLQLSALEQAELIRSRQVSSVDITKIYLDRIARLDGQLNAFVSVFDKEALKTAAEVDRKAEAGEPLPLFAGVPTAIKDFNIVAGHTLGVGSRACLLRWSPVDDLLVRRLRAGGFVFMGKTRMSEFGALPLTISKFFPPAANPWDASKNAGGSSGGAGGAVAAGLVPIAHGVDGAGSIRIPSALCHLFGFKPSRGLIGSGVFLDSPRNIVVDGPMARDVRDAAAMTDVMSGATRTGALSMLHASAEQVRPLKVKVALKNQLVDPEPAIAAATLRFAKALEERGDTLSDGDMPDINVDEFLPIWERAIGMFPFVIWPLTEPVSHWLRGRYKRNVGFDYDANQDRVTARLQQWFGDADIWVSPTTPIAAPGNKWIDTSAPGEEQFRKAAPLGAYTAVVNVLGYPAITIPMGFNAEGMPIGVQVMARHGQDALLFAIARWAEQKFPWKQHWPAGFGPV